MDIEGYELAAIRGMKKMLRTRQPHLLIEFHPRLLRERFALEDKEICDFLTDLREFGYKVHFNGHHYQYRAASDKRSDEDWHPAVPNNVN